ncbi:hypothetical protein MCHI_003842, partial [Candidatus Magnetoovum chiemensis]
MKDIFIDVYHDIKYLLVRAFNIDSQFSHLSKKQYFEIKYWSLTINELIDWYKGITPVRRGIKSPS